MLLHVSLYWWRSHQIKANSVLLSCRCKMICESHFQMDPKSIRLQLLNNSNKVLKFNSWIKSNPSRFETHRLTITLYISQAFGSNHSSPYFRCFPKSTPKPQYLFRLCTKSSPLTRNIVHKQCFSSNMMARDARNNPLTYTLFFYFYRSNCKHVVCLPNNRYIFRYTVNCCAIASVCIW